MSFKLRRLRIHELKSIHRLDHVFHDEGLTLFGRNGSGKTTLLEAISLLGHLGVMALAPLAATAPKDRAPVRKGPSLLNAALGAGGAGAIIGSSPRLRARFAELTARLAPYVRDMEPHRAKPEEEVGFEASASENVVEAAFDELSQIRDMDARSLVLFDVICEGEPVSLLVQLADRDTDLTVALSHEFSDRDAERALTLYY
ncbi:MAG: hypothetical protein HKP27_11685, partial [Myxococcales bacterium]|nr:hypothetical protein [Myxococcales bacterium]